MIEVESGVVLEAVKKAQIHLFSKQSNEGWWSGDIYVNAWTLAVYILLTEHLDTVNRSTEAKIINWLIKHQNPNGSWGATDESRIGDISVTAACALALEVARVRVNTSIIARANNYVRSKGGIRKVDPRTQLLYAVHNKYPWEQVFTLPIEIMLSPQDFERQFCSWEQSVEVPCMIIVTLNKFPCLTVSQKRALHRAQLWLLQHQNDDGSWFDTFFSTSFSCLALHKLGYDTSNSRVSSALRWLDEYTDEEGYVHYFRLPIWDTALAMSALTDSGVVSSQTNFLRAAKWLLKNQVPFGKWPFNPHNVFYLDADDTALAIIALSRVRSEENELESLRRKSLKEGGCWLIYQQNEDGGWATYDLNQDIRHNGAPPFFTEDPSCADITGHVLSALGCLGYDTSAPEVRKAIEFLKYNQLEVGSWHARWGVTYIYGTCCVLLGLRDVKEDMSRPYIQKAVDWLISHQNFDGGWGESYWSYFKPRFAGMGKSTVEQTAWSVIGLLAAGETPFSSTIQKGIKYILRLQNQDGGWTASYTAAALSPYKHTLYGDIFGLQALGMYQNSLTNV